ncbi:uncharacterized [Tachysurus ichikawai]
MFTGASAARIENQVEDFVVYFHLAWILSTGGLPDACGLSELLNILRVAMVDDAYLMSTSSSLLENSWL